MTKGTQFDLSGFILQQDGTYKKKSTSIQPRDLEKKITVVTGATITNYGPDGPSGKVEVHTKEITKPKILRRITLNLFGEPMPKQSVRSFIQNGEIMHFQPKEFAIRKADYLKQMKEQLPEDFVMFTERVHITKLHFIFAPLKAFHKIKGRMDAIRNGEIFYKATRGDLDNYIKPFFDSLSETVFADDALVVSVDNMKKFYGNGGCIIVDLAGY